MKIEKLFIKKDEISNYYCSKFKKYILSTKDMSQSGIKTNYCRKCGQGLD